MLKNMKKIYKIFFCMFIGTIGMVNVLANDCPNCDENLEVFEDNKQGIKLPTNIHDGSGYEYSTSYLYPTVTTITITTKDGTAISKTFTTENVSNYYSLDDVEVLDGLENALDSNGQKNNSYLESVLSQGYSAVNDGKFVDDSPIASMIVEALTIDGHCNDFASCGDYIASLPGDEDGFDLIGEPKLIIKENATGKISYADGDENGIKGSGLMENMKEAAYAGHGSNVTGVEPNEKGKIVLNLKADLCGTKTPPPDYTPIIPDLEDLPLPDLRHDELPENDVGDMACGQPFTGTFYEWGEPMDSCGLTKFRIKTVINVSAPADVSTITAGNSFGWSGGDSSMTTTLEDGGSELLNSTMERNATELSNVNKQIEALNENLSKNEDLLAEAEAELAKCNNLPDYISKTSCPIINGKKKCTTTQVVNSEKIRCQSSLNASVAKIKAAIERIKKQIEGKKKLQKSINDRRKELADCQKEYQENFKNLTAKNEDNVVTITDKQLTIAGQTQAAGSVTSVDKGTGKPSTGGDNTMSTNGDEFFISASIANGTQGKLTQTITLPNGQSFDIQCKVNISNTIMGCITNCGTPNPTPPSPDHPNPEPEIIEKAAGINIIYRPISLTNPFPYADSSSAYRKRISIWSNDYIVNKIITNNREVNGYEVYNLTPMYTITLTPADIKDIRAYNKNHDYSDFTLKCKKGLYCESQFLRNEIIHMIDVNKSCAIGNDWYGCDSETLGKYRDGFLGLLR